MNSIVIITDNELIQNPEYENILNLFVIDPILKEEVKKTNDIPDLYSYSPNFIKINELRVWIPFVTIELKINDKNTFIAVLPEYINGNKIHEISSMNGLKIKKMIFQFLSENFTNYFEIYSNDVDKLNELSNGIAFKGDESLYSIFKYK
jgi:hypothetical protein